MTVANWVALGVAVVAAVASIVAALLARRSAKDAHRSADGIDRRRHMIEALDHESESFRVAYESLVRSVSGIGDTGTQAGMLRELGGIVAASAVIKVHPRSSDESRSLVDSVSQQIIAILATRKTLDGFDPLMISIEEGARTVIVEMSRERRELLANLRAVGAAEKGSGELWAR